MPGRNLDTLTEQADDVVMGSATHVSDLGPRTVSTFNNTFGARQKEAVVLVDRVLKGPAGLSSFAASTRSQMSS